MIVLGIVGTPAGGKSTVAERLVELGATWIDADVIAKEVSERPDVQDDLKQHYGPAIVDKDADHAHHDALLVTEDEERGQTFDCTAPKSINVY